MTMKRFRVAEESMLPALEAGDEFVATDSRRPEIGDVVAFPHPDRPGFWMVKRMAEPPRPLSPDQAWVLSDNLDATRADSRTLGRLAISDLMPRVEHLDAGTFVEACALLADDEEALAGAIDRHGIPEFWQRKPGLETLVLLILEQQVSLESGAAMYRRLQDLLGTITDDTLLASGADGLRSIGVTRQKAGYLVALATAISADQLDPDALASFPADEARNALIGLRGVGPWTADAYLLSALRLPDVFPVGDRALQVGTAEVLGMGRPPDEEELEILSQPWRPIRAAAARIIWHNYLSERGRVEPPRQLPARDPSPEA